MLVLELSPQENCQSCRPSGLHDELAPTAHHSWSSPIVRRDLRHAVQVNRTSACMISAFDWRRMVRSCQDFPAASSLMRVQASLESDRRSCHYQSPTSSRFPRDDIGATDIRKTRFDLRHALDCELATVTGRALSQSARTAHPFGLPFACSISGITGSLQSPFPARLHAASGLHHQLRYPGCSSDFSATLARHKEDSVHTADLLRLQNL